MNSIQQGVSMIGKGEAVLSQQTQGGKDIVKGYLSQRWKNTLSTGRLIIALVLVPAFSVACAEAQSTVQLFDSKVKTAVSEIVDLNIKTAATKQCAGKKKKAKAARYGFSASAQLPSSRLSLRASTSTGGTSCDVEFPVVATLTISKQPATAIKFSGTLVRRQDSGTGAPLYDGILVDPSKGTKGRQPLVLHVVGVEVKEQG